MLQTKVLYSQINKQTYTQLSSHIIKYKVQVKKIDNLSYAFMPSREEERSAQPR